ncbi:hypothetical protein Sste5346_002707 [Sporothrix stenoceras]|uniref:Small ribosomal subunit protein uS7 domain-containing protein n=1 Tax=Sporothrix stenoceras TaxID=5173 RepID=A0ABR3ZGQ3_9PEZI
MSTSRMAPLWRSSSRCLALRPQATTTTAPLPRTMTISVAATNSRPELAVRQRATGAPVAVRNYSNDATTQNNEPTTGNSQDIVASISSQGESSQQPGEGAVDPVVERLAKLEAAKQEALNQFNRLAKGKAGFDVAFDGHKFGLTTAATRASTAKKPEGEEDYDLSGGESLPVVGKLQERHDPVIYQLTRLLMRDGKLAKAERNMATILNFLRTAPPPKLNASFPLLPGHPPAIELPLDPVRYITLIVDSVAPLIKINHLAGQAGGGRALPVPVPITERQRRRTAFAWILESAENKPSRGSGRDMFANRVAEEIIAVAEGRSSAWDKRLAVHKLGTASRINVKALTSTPRRFGKRN